MKEERDIEKKEITERFLKAMDFLNDSGRIKSFAALEKITGIRQQKITAIRNCLNGESKFGNYVTISQIKVVHEKFQISLEYIFTGMEPIISEKTNPVIHKIPVNGSIGLKELREEMNLIREKVNLLSEKLEFYKELVNQKLS